MTITHGSFNLTTGEHKKGATEVVVRECGTPIFGDSGRASGICASCRKGWETEGNAPTERGREQIAEGLAKLVFGESAK
jgi:hypothetical protein